MPKLSRGADSTNHFPTEGAEKAILGIILFCPRTLGEAIESDLQPRDFVAPHHEAIFDALLDLHGKGQLGAPEGSIDHLIVYGRMGALQTADALKLHGHEAYLITLQNEYGQGHIADHITVVKLAANRREQETIRALSYRSDLEPSRRDERAERLRDLRAEEDALLLRAAGWPGEPGPPVPLDDADVPPWPDDALPPTIAAYVDAVADFVSMPRDLPALVALGAMAACWARKVRVVPFEGYSEALCIYAVAAADVSERKSSAYAAIEFPIRKYEEEYRDAQAPAWSKYRADKAVLEEQLRYAIQKAKKPGTDEDAAGGAEETVHSLQCELDSLKKPPRADFLTQDCTAEGLARLMSETGGHACLMSPEGGGIFDLLIGRYDKQPNLDVYLKAYGGEPIVVTRANREREIAPIAQPSLCMAITTQPRTLRRLADKDELGDRGLLARMIYAIPSDSKVGYRPPVGRPIPSCVRDAYERAMLAALRIEWPSEPHVLTFSDSALAAYRVLAGAIESRLRPDGDLRELRGWAGKLTGKIVRIAALFHLMEHVDQREPWTVPLRVEAFQRAARLTEYLIAHARRAFGVMKQSRQMDGAHKLLGHLTRDRLQTFTTRQAQRILRSGTADDVRPTLELLAVHGQIAKVTGQRRDSERWIVHPATVKSWKQRAASPHTGKPVTVGTLP